MSVFPTDTAGGVIIRDAAGNPITPAPAGVENAYTPPAAFVSTCEMTALPSTCEARIEPRQINAIVSELVAFAECLDPNGPWDCASMRNLCAAFNEWVTVNLRSFVYISDDPPAAAVAEDLWWESDTGNLFLLYDDSSSLQWVQVNASAKSMMDKVSIIGAGDAADPHSVGLVDCGSY